MNSGIACLAYLNPLIACLASQSSDWLDALWASCIIRRNLSEGWQRGRGRAGRGVWRPNPQDFPSLYPQGVVYRPMGRGEPVVGRSLGRGRGEPEVGRGLGRGYRGPLGYLRDIRPLGHFPPPPSYASCDPNPPPYDTLFLPPYSVGDPDMSPCDAPCPFPHYNDPLFSPINTQSSPSLPM